MLIRYFSRIKLQSILPNCQGPFLREKHNLLNSPDLNPIENSWDKLLRLGYKDGRQFNSKSELEDAIRTSCNNLETDFIKN